MAPGTRGCPLPTLWVPVQHRGGQSSRKVIPGCFSPPWHGHHRHQVTLWRRTHLQVPQARYQSPTARQRSAGTCRRASTQHPALSVMLQKMWAQTLPAASPFLQGSRATLPLGAEEKPLAGGTISSTNVFGEQLHLAGCCFCCLCEPLDVLQVCNSSSATLGPFSLSNSPFCPLSSPPSPPSSS